MAYFLAGFAALIAMMLLGGAFSRANTSAIAFVLRAGAGIVCLAFGVLLAIRGAVGYAIPAVGLGLYLLSKAQSQRAFGGGGTQSASGQTSRVQTRTLNMELDLQTGSIEGQVTRGTYAGRSLEMMSPAEVADLWQTCTFDDPESAQILEAYLDRRHANWREDFARATGGSSGASGSGEGMSVSEARAVLGVDESATLDEITQAYKRKMKEAHPDRGGSSDDAIRINRAKDILFGK